MDSRTRCRFPSFLALLLATVFAFALQPLAHAADATPPAAQTVIDQAPAASAASQPAVAPVPFTMPEGSQMIVVCLTPLIIAGVRKLMPNINPSWFPLLAILTGCALSLLMHFTTGLNVNWWQGLLLGAGGIGLREFCDQIKKEVAAS